MILRSMRRARFALGGHVNLATFAHEMASIWGDRPMATDAESNSTITYRDAAATVDEWARRIAPRISVGNPVVVSVPGGIEQFLMCLAVARAGGLPAPVNPQMQPFEIDHVIADSGAELNISSVRDLTKGRRKQAAELPKIRVEKSDVAALFYTSGTTGHPKGAALSHAALIGQMSTAALFPAEMAAGEVVIALPVAHIMGFIALVGLATAGLDTHVHSRFHATDVLDAIEHRHASAFIGVPAMYRMMWEAGAEQRDLKSIRVWMSGADVMPGDLARRFKAMGAAVELPVLGALGEASFVEGYGMVEVGGGVAAKISPPYSAIGMGDSVGFRLPGYHFKVVDPQDRDVPVGSTGELWVKGPGVLRGYWNDPAATAEVVTDDGWLRTGDLVRRGLFGTVAFAGRTKHIIKSGGFSVYPIEIEGVLETHPDVVEAVVVGLVDPTLGEVPAAAVRMSDTSKVTEDQLLEWIGRRVAHYKAPQKLVFTDDLPRTGTNKVQKLKVAELFGRDAADV